jgi:hypothetical protein
MELVFIFLQFSINRQSLRDAYNMVQYKMLRRSNLFIENSLPIEVKLRRSALLVFQIILFANKIVLDADLPAGLRYYYCSNAWQYELHNTAEKKEQMINQMLLSKFL